MFITEKQIKNSILVIHEMVNNESSLDIDLYKGLHLEICDDILRQLGEKAF